MKKSIIAAAVLFCFSGTTLAQADYKTSDGASRVFRSHWYISGQLGGQYTLGEAKFGDLLSPNVQGSLGYQFCPAFGLRLSVNAWQSKGGWNGYKPTATSPAGTVTYKFKYVAPSLDFMFNLSNVLCGWNPDRVVNVSAFVGAGANYAGGNSEAADLAAKGYDLRYLWTGRHWRATGRGGVAVDFRLNDYVSLGVEGNVNVLNDKYNSKKAGNADWYFNALAGVKINLGKSYKKKTAAVPVRTAEPVVEPAQPAKPTVAKVEKVEKIQRDVFFKINSSVISSDEETKVSELAAYLKKHSDAKVEITGYADAGTGNDVINDRISSRRAESVKKMLVDKYGIDASRVSVSSKGSRVQPFTENDKNRVTICVAE